ncbi:L-threonylcarbamoyladenylate synthase [Candidatus Formimonas warabiya]|uniref:Threonylcarbamoyl-AMP synthase n=1 Tax=Formimonas warabiya TaxID=1761012 RepID=A0A3G1KU79_FORW1|nr:L-threonylcarbamoyladenylate synthase [Candidatus Formimonas warabiya]ATW25990.1 threonylcarbamoyl-AMP synthase [Candidatus Formimonas warabiya]
METEYIIVDPLKPDQNALKKGARLLQQGEVVAFPTETVYGLGANALDVQAVKKIYLAKGRPSDNPLIVHVADREQLIPLVKEVPEKAYDLIDKFWPGPLTLIFPKSALVPGEVTAGLDTVAVRMPKHPVALALIKEANVPVAAPSANASGKPSPTEGKHVWADLNGKIPLVLDGGATKVGVESTVLDVTGDLPLILRPGGVTREELQSTIGPVEYDPGLTEKKVPRAPGMKYTHYSPEADVVLITGEAKERKEKMKRLFLHLTQEGKKVALLLSEETQKEMTGQIVPYYQEVLGSRQDLSGIAHRLFSAFRNCDLSGAEIILIEEFSHQGMGAAVMNRIRKAAGGVQDAPLTIDMGDLDD